ncbi:MAG: V-type ATP synthase subunit F, partial [Clostridia bacterium]
MFNNEMNTKVGVIGDKDVISAFKSVGFDVFHATTGDEVRELYKELVRKEYAVLYITEELAIKAPDIIK